MCCQFVYMYLFPFMSLFLHMETDNLRTNYKGKDNTHQILKPFLKFLQPAMTEAQQTYSGLRMRLINPLSLSSLSIYLFIRYCAGFSCCVWLFSCSVSRGWFQHGGLSLCGFSAVDTGWVYGSAVAVHRAEFLACGIFPETRDQTCVPLCWQVDS